MIHAFGRRLIPVVVAAALAAATGVLATAGTAVGATPTARPTSASTSTARDYVPACPQKPARGYFTCFAMQRTNVKESPLLAPGATRTGVAPSVTPAGYGPAQIQSAYNLPAATGTPLVAIVDAYDDPNAESDLAVYRAQFGLAACTTANGCFEKVGQDGTANYPPPSPANDDWGAETSLDLDSVSAACPACHILLVEANSDNDADLLSAVSTARTMGAKFISMSWGGPEDGTENSADAKYFDYPGIDFSAASGDNGYGAGPIYPSTSQYTVSVGGTTLTQASGTTRGWTETAWEGAGSGCSVDVPKPEFQSGITACSTRADTDLSADADPNTGLAVYDTYSSTGWGVYGGTSLATPLITAMYALAGTPAAGTWPASYPYNDPNQSADLNDVTSGATGACTPLVLCEAGPGWDGPTGLGTPNGVGALIAGPHGFLSGTVTDSATGKPVAGATVTAGAYTVNTNASGDYNLEVLPGSYTETVTEWDYGSGSASATVADDASVTQNFALTPVPTSTISGTVTDGSGHNWPMRAKITVSGDPEGPVYSSAYTGKYSVTLPDNASYTLSVSAMDMPGYTGQQVTVDLAAADVTQNIALTVDQSTCTAPGYADKNSGLTQNFSGWTGNTAQDGWTVTDNNGSGDTWGFNNPGSPSYVDPPPNNDASFASVDDYAVTTASDTSLTSPVIDLSGATDPQIVFDLGYVWVPGETANVDLSLDGGTTWSTVWSVPETYPAQMDIPIPEAAGNSDVMVRFHWTFNPETSSENGRWWSIGNVSIGEHTCSPLTGGLVEGVVSDANTGKPVNGAKVTSESHSSQVGTTGPTTSDPDLPDGYYWLFSSHTGRTGFKLTDANYAATSVRTSVTSSAVTQANFKIDAGRLTVSKRSVSLGGVLGASESATVTLGNNGTAPVHVSLSGDDAGFTAAGAGALTALAADAAPVAVKTHASLRALTGTAGAGGTTVQAAAAEAGKWTDIAGYPTAVADDTVAEYAGKLYVVGGNNGTYELPNAYVYNASAGTWQAIAPLPEPLGASAAGFIGNTLYVAGGWDSQGGPSADVWAYNTATNTWKQKASLPITLTEAGSAVVGGKLYVIDGCSGTCAAPSKKVYSYDPGDNTWSTQPGKPHAAEFPACGGVDALVVCAGGAGAGSSTYTYDPGSKGWVKKNAMPDDAWGAAATTANGQLDVIGGIIDSSTAVTNEGFAFDPEDNTWSALPNANDAFYRGGAACGLYQVGGAIAGGSPASLAQTLPGYDQCGGMPDWMGLSTASFTIKPGKTVTVRVRVRSSAVSQPGTYDGQLVIRATTPYPSLTPVGVTMRVTPPKTWGEITGKVTTARGAPISGVTVAICTRYSAKSGTCGPETFTLTTDSKGEYQLWLNHGFNPLEVIAAIDGYTPGMKIAKVTAGDSISVNFTLAATSTKNQAAIQQYLRAHEHLRTA
jgi:N-acetylneuraminic acid mutarotase